VSSAALDKQISDFSLGQQVNISYISEYNQTLLQEVKSNQAVFVSLNASSFLEAAGVAAGVAALQAIQNTAACGSRTYTESNAFECLRICTSGSMANCRIAAAYGYIAVHSHLLSLVNPYVLANISAMNSTVNAIVPSIGAADLQLKTALGALSSGFARFNKCEWIGKSFVTIRTNLCGNVADTINVMWLCCGILAFILMYMPIVLVKAEKRFKRKNPNVERFNLREKSRAKIAAAEQLRRASIYGTRPLNSSPAIATASSVTAAASEAVVIVDIPQNMCAAT
jgi:hypothetical protein